MIYFLGRSLEGGRVTETVVACTVLNQMTERGRPQSYSIGR